MVEKAWGCWQDYPTPLQLLPRALLGGLQGHLRHQQQLLVVDSSCLACDGQQLWHLHMADQVLAVLNKRPAKRFLAGAVASIAAVIPAPCCRPNTSCCCSPFLVVVMTYNVLSVNSMRVSAHTAAVAVSSVTTPGQHSCAQTTGATAVVSAGCWFL